MWARLWDILEKCSKNLASQLFASKLWFMLRSVAQFLLFHFRGLHRFLILALLLTVERLNGIEKGSSKAKLILNWIRQEGTRHQRQGKGSKMNHLTRCLTYIPLPAASQINHWYWCSVLKCCWLISLLKSPDFLIFSFSWTGNPNVYFQTNLARAVGPDLDP